MPEVRKEERHDKKIRAEAVQAMLQGNSTGAWFPEIQLR